MPHPLPLPSFWRPLLALLVLLAAGAAGRGAAAADGILTGRIQNAAGQYLNNVRLTVAGSSQVTFTDESGSFRLDGLPRGPVRVDVFYTGLEPGRIEADLAAEPRRDVALTLAGGSRYRDDRGIIQLESLVVSTSREMDGAAIAINEQRFAPNLMNVVAADEFGIVPDGNIGEFLKMLPGITMDYRGGDPREISMNGVPSAYVPVTVGGFSLATSEVSGTGRNVELNAISINNLSRIEAVYSPTPESPGSALAGSVNLVPRSAFERARPAFNSSVYLAMRDSTKEFHRSPGPQREPTHKVRPGFEFSWVMPVSRRFGFTLSGGASTLYTEGPLLTNTWRGAGAATNGGTLPDTTPDRPYLTDFLVRTESKIADRTSLATTVDWRVGAAGRLSFAFQYGTFHTNFNQRALSFLVNRVNPGDFSTRFTRGFVGAGEIRLNNGGNHRYSRTLMPTLAYRHDGPVWKAEAGVGASHAQNRFRNVDQDRFGSTQARRTGVTVSFDDIFYLRPQVITVTDGGTGRLVNPYDLREYALSTAGGSPQQSRNVQSTAYANIRRGFGGAVPLELKAGVDFRRSRSDNRTTTLAYNYVGADGRATTPLEVSRLTFLDREASVRKEYLRWFPSLNASQQMTENLILRAAWYPSVGRPNFNQYSGGVTLPDVETPPSNTNRITVNNAGIKAWSARTTKVGLEYYFERIGLLSAGAFRRDFENFFGSTVFDATPEFLSLYGLDPVLYDRFDVATQYNLPGRVRMEGYDLNYRQALTFLPRWARGLQVFANGSVQRVTGVNAGQFAGFYPKSGNWGISLTRETYNVRLNWNYLGRQRRGPVTGRSIEPGTFTWGSKRSYIDVTAERTLGRRFALFANLRNVNDPTDDVEIHGPSTPAEAQFRQRAEFGSLWTVGLKGSF